MVQISKANLLRFYDQINRSSRAKEIQGPSPGSHVSAITGMIGEDLVLGLFQHYWAKKFKSGNCEILGYQCRVSEGTKRSKKLDAWLLCKKKKDGRRTLYQTEVKNWSAYSRGTKNQIRPGAGVNEQSREQWQKITGDDRNQDALKKVKFTPRMDDLENTTDASGQRVNDLYPKPLLCLWLPVATDKSNGECFFKTNTPNYLNDVWVFSASLCLRGLPDDEPICISVPRVEHRLQLLNEIMPGFPIASNRST